MKLGFPPPHPPLMLMSSSLRVDKKISNIRESCAVLEAVAPAGVCCGGRRASPARPLAACVVPPTLPRPTHLPNPHTHTWNKRSSAPGVR